MNPVSRLALHSAGAACIVAAGAFLLVSAVAGFIGRCFLRGWVAIRTYVRKKERTA